MFCGSSAGARPIFAEAAADLGRTLARRGLDLVYGGGSAGLMGTVATAVLAGGGDVTGVLPAGLFPDGVTASPLRDDHGGTLEVLEVADMHARKARFHALGDAFVVLPGGLGTLEELAEVATWAQIGLHDKPIGFLDVDGYWDGLFAWIDRAVADGFVKAANRDRLWRSADPGALLDLLDSNRGRAEAPWIEP